MSTLEEYLKKVFFDPKHPAFFAHPKKLLGMVREQGYHPTLKFLREWTQDQESYSLHKSARKKFQQTKVITKGIRHMYDADLADLSDLAEYNDHVKFLLVVIDDFTRKLAVRPLVTKTASDVRHAFEDIFKSDLKAPELLRTDGGREFDNRVLQKYLKDMNVRYQVTSNQTKANYSERVIKTLKGKITRYLTHNNTKTYLPVLEKLVRGYNNSKHSTTKMKPNEVTESNSKQLWWRIYKPRKSRLKRIKSFLYRVGDEVRITYLKNIFSREYDQNWTGEVFTIRRRYRLGGIPVYQLQDIELNPIRGVFYTEELQKIRVDPDHLWKIDKVLKTRKRKGKTEYLVSWLHWPPRFSSWVTNIQNL